MEEQQQHLQEVEEFSDGLLAELLAQSGLIPPEQLAEAQRRIAEWDVADEIPMGKPCLVTPGQDALAIGEAQVALSDAFAIDSTDWPRYSNGKLIVCDLLEAKIHREVDASMAGGLIPTSSGSFFYPGKAPIREQSPQLPCLPSPIMASAAVRSGPIDLVPSAGGEFMVAANRGAGTVHVIVPGVPSQVGALALRAAGSKRSMGVAIHHKTAYLTDGLTPRLTILDLVQWKVRHQTFPTGPLGSIAISPDGQTLYICFYRNTDELGFLTVSTQDLRVRHLLNLPARKVVDAPGELLALVPSGNLAYLVAGSQEIPHAYQLLGIDVSKKKIVKALPLGNLPLAIAFEPPKAWLPRKRNLRETLVEMGVITHQEIERLLNSDPSMSPLDDPALDPSVLSQLPERLIRLMAIVPLYRQGQALHVAMVNPQDTTTRQLAQQLAGNLQLNIIPITSDDLERFLTGRYQTLIESLASMRSMTPTPNPPASPKETNDARETKENKPEQNEEAPVSPESLPSQVRTPDIRKAPPVHPVIEKPKIPIPASVDQWVGFKDAHLLLVEGMKRQVIELDADHKEVWSFKGALIGYAAYLPNGNYLMVDLGNHRIFEMDPQRQILWQFGDPQDRQKQLRSPRGASRIASGNTLIVDTGNHRVLEVDPAGEIVWQYGETGRAGCSGQSLFKPHWARRLPNGNTLIVDTGNHRVLEVDVQKNVIWQYGNSVNRLGSGQGSGLNQLSEPSCASLLPNGHYLIVDTGNQRVLEVDALRQLIWHYRPGAVKGGHAVKDPLLAARLDNGRTLVVGRQAVIEVDAELQAVWDNHKERDGQTPNEASLVVPVRLGVDLPPNLLETAILVDRNGSRLVEADRKKQVVWQYSGLVGGEKNRLLHPHYAVRLTSGNTLAVDTGNHRVVEIRDNAVVWQFGRKGEPGDSMKQLCYPHSAERSADGRTLIADTNNRRVLEVNSAGDVVWLKTELAGPYYAIRLPGGRILVTLWGSHQVVELDDSGRVVWSYGQGGFAGHGPNQLFHPEFATRLENGNTLIADTQNHRVLEVNAERHVVWQYGGAPEFLGRIGRFGVQLNTPVACWRLPEGNTLVIHAGKNHAVELDPELTILWQYTLQ